MAESGPGPITLGERARMELRALGSTGIRVSPLGLGTVKFGRNSQVKYPRAFQLPDDYYL